MPATPGVPAATVGRLVTYLRLLTAMEERGVRTTSSDELAGRSHVSAFQVRKDLAYFGRFGTRGAGYTVATLRRELRRILGLTRPWNVAIMGMGRLGQALADYPNFDEYDFRLVAAFDADPAKAGLPAGGLFVEGLEVLPARATELTIDLAFLTVPGPAAQAAADALVAAGIRGILNFAPAVLEVPPHVHVEPVDLMAGLKRLSYHVVARAEDDAA
ncbi:MAG: redox-sensing transcriptional repressor Rex [Trueperaceae bacterium]|nr:redox-sensing transcriptional repressor Rex [Trueperaceae bacterium]